MKAVGGLLLRFVIVVCCAVVVFLEEEESAPPHPPHTAQCERNMRAPPIIYLPYPKLTTFSRTCPLSLSLSLSLSLPLSMKQRENLLVWSESIVNGVVAVLACSFFKREQRHGMDGWI